MLAAQLLKIARDKFTGAGESRVFQHNPVGIHRNRRRVIETQEFSTGDKGETAALKVCQSPYF